MRPSFELLIGLYALTTAEPKPSAESWVPSLADCSAQLRAALEPIGIESGELWLHLLGIALEQPVGSASDFVDQLGEVDAADLRRHIVGVHVPAWRSAVGAELLERAADGDAAAADRILRDECYYGGQARNALTAVLPMSAAQTKRRVLGAVRRFTKEVFADREVELLARLRDAGTKHTVPLAGERAEQTIARITGGYAYTPEPGLDQVVLVPHLAAPPWLLLCQHRNARLICFPAGATSEDPETELRNQLLRLGRALGDEKRIEILRRLTAGPASLNDLVRETGLVKSTVHHHLAQLRAAQLITVEGKAKGLIYRVARDGLADGRSIFDTMLATTTE